MRKCVLLLTGLLVVTLGAVSVSRADSPPVYQGGWGSFGTGPGQFNQPFGIAVDNGLVYVADQLNERVQVFTAGGAFVRSWQTDPADDPTGLAIGPSGHVYVSMHHAGIIRIYSNSGAFLGQIGSLGTAPGQLYYPVGIAIDAAGYVYVADSGNHRIQKFSAGGAWLMEWGGLNTPYGIAANPAGDIFVTESGGHQVQMFDYKGGFLGAWGSQGSGDGQLIGTDGVDFDPAGNLLVVDAGTNSRVEKFTTAGAFLSQFGGFGTAPGQLRYPADVAADAYGNIYVTDWYNHRISVWGTNPTAAKSSTWGRLKSDYR